MRILKQQTAADSQFLDFVLLFHGLQQIGAKD